MSTEDVLEAVTFTEHVDGLATEGLDIGSTGVGTETPLVDGATGLGRVRPQQVVDDDALGSVGGVVALDDRDTRKVGVGEDLETVVFTTRVLRETTVDAEDLLVDFGGDGEVLEDFVDGDPDFHTLFAAEALQALVLEGGEGIHIDITIDFRRLVVASEKEDAVGGDGLEERRYMTHSTPWLPRST